MIKWQSYFQNNFFILDVNGEVKSRNGIWIGNGLEVKGYGVWFLF